MFTWHNLPIILVSRKNKCCDTHTHILTSPDCELYAVRCCCWHNNEKTQRTTYRQSTHTNEMKFFRFPFIWCFVELRCCYRWCSVVWNGTLSSTDNRGKQRKWQCSTLPLIQISSLTLWYRRHSHTYMKPKEDGWGLVWVVGGAWRRNDARSRSLRTQATAKSAPKQLQQSKEYIVGSRE